MKGKAQIRVLGTNDGGSGVGELHLLADENGSGLGGVGLVNVFRIAQEAQIFRARLLQGGDTGYGFHPVLRAGQLEVGANGA